MHQQLALGDVVAFLHQDFGDSPIGIGIDVGLILLHGLDLTVGGYNLGQILPLDFAGLDRHHSPSAPHDPTQLKPAPLGPPTWGHHFSPIPTL